MIETQPSTATPNSMKELIELQGSSGSKYRFRLVPSVADLPPVGGNFAYVKYEGDKVKVLCVGAGMSLRQAADHWERAVSDLGAQAIYVRLNIARKVRILEHDDLQATYPGGERESD